MKIAEVHMKGFRNFKNAKFNFNNHTAIMGFNDVGKTNLIYALRLLLDRNISEAEMELGESDFFAYEDTNDIEIVIKFDDVVEDFVLSKIKEAVSDEDITYLKYTISKNDADFKIFAGPSLELLEEIQGRYYLKAFNLKYVGSSRNLSSFIRKEKKYLLEKAKEARVEAEEESDAQATERVEANLSALNTEVRNISYVKNATNQINDELNKLSFKNESQELVLDMAGDDMASLLQKVDLSVSTNGKMLAIGGDGKLNQIFLALWTNKYNIDLGDLSEVSFYCIEEPEAHLHPHQQRKLSEYLAQTLNNQVIITTHSPQIISEFKPNSIIKLYEKDGASSAANDGCSNEIEDELFNFAHRLDIVSTEAFYSNLVFLVEGQSEILFYKALAKAIDIDLDKLNISILMVDGVGFKPYIKVLELLQIPWVMRTDNDIFQVPQSTDLFRCAGIQRGIGIYEDFRQEEAYSSEIEESIAQIKSFTEPIDFDVEMSTFMLAAFLEDYSIYLSQVDLEADLVNSPIFNKIQDFFNPKMSIGQLNNASEEELLKIPSVGRVVANNIVTFRQSTLFATHEDLLQVDGVGEATKNIIENGIVLDKDEALKQMQERKGGLMFEFLYKYQDDLSILATDPISKPLLKCKEIIEANL